MMDISDTLAPNSEQLDAVDLLGGARTFTVERVTKGSAEQPINVKLAEFARVWRPGKSMRRVLASAWGTDASKWTGRRLTLWCDPSVKFGGIAVGGIRISHMSHIDKDKTVVLLESRGKSALYVVKPLGDTPAAPSLKSRVWDRSREIEPDLGDDERRNWIKGELADLGGDTPENLTALLTNWETK